MKRLLPLLAITALVAYPLRGDQGAPQVLSTTTGSSSTTTSSSQPPPPRHGDRLTPDEMQQLHAAREAAFKSNPDLEAEGKDLAEKMRAHEKKVDDAMVKADPNVAPLIAKMEQERMRHRPGMDGPPPPPVANN